MWLSYLVSSPTSRLIVYSGCDALSGLHATAVDAGLAFTSFDPRLAASFSAFFLSASCRLSSATALFSAAASSFALAAVALFAATASLFASDAVFFIAAAAALASALAFFAASASAFFATAAAFLASSSTFTFVALGGLGSFGGFGGFEGLLPGGPFLSRPSLGGAGGLPTSPSAVGTSAIATSTTAAFGSGTGTGFGVSAFDGPAIGLSLVSAVSQSTAQHCPRMGQTVMTTVPFLCPPFAGGSTGKSATASLATLHHTQSHPTGCNVMTSAF